MKKIEGRFIICPKDNKILTYTECMACNALAQILNFNDYVRVECLHNHKSIFNYGVRAEYIGDNLL